MTSFKTMPGMATARKTDAVRLTVPSWAVLLVVLCCFLPTGLFIYQNGLSSFRWDDSEYVYQALDTFDHVAASGYVSWPAFIAEKQHYGKPPLYVNTLALFLQIFGRERAPVAAAALAVASSMLLGLVVYALVQGVAGPGHALLAVVGIAGVPCVARWATVAFPDLQLATIVLAIVSLLGGQGAAWPRRRTLALGLLLGLGMLAKATLPLFVGLPLLYWLWQGTSEVPDRARRFRILFSACGIGAVLASIWYIPNGREAVLYARSSYGFTLAPDTSLAARLGGWATVLFTQGLGYVLAMVFIFGLLAVVLAKRTPGPPPGPANGLLVRLMLLGAIPAVAVALTSPIPPNTRHLLPTLLLFAMALLLVLFRNIRSSRFEGPVFAAVAFCFAGQWMLTAASEVPSLAGALRESAAAPHLARFAPTLVDVQAVSWDLVDAVVSHVEGGGDIPPLWYLSGNDIYLNVPRLQLAAKVGRLPVRFEYTGYFSWSAEEREAALKRAQLAPSIIVVLERPWNHLDSDTAYLNRYAGHVRQFVDDPASGFRKLSTETRSGYSLIFYSNASPTTQSVTALPPVYANFGGKVLLTGAGVSDGKLMLRLKLKTPVSVNYKLLLHGRTRDSSNVEVPRVWDQYLNPPLSTWQVGESRVVTFTLPAEYGKQPHALDVGFFDESDAAHSWPPLKLTTGESVFTLPPETVPAGTAASPAGR